MSVTEQAANAPQAPVSRRGLLGYFAGNPVAANMLMILILVSGVAAGLNIAVEDLPAYDLRTLSITVHAPGASPREVEEDIVRRVEESVIGFEGVSRITSRATENLARIFVELTPFASQESVLDDVQRAVDSLEDFPPANAEQPEVAVMRLQREVMSLAVRSAHLNEDALRTVAEEVRRQLLNLPSTARVDLHGARDREISIEVGEEELRRHNLTLAEIASVVRRTSLNVTSGELRTDAGGVVLHTVAERTRAEDFADIPLVTGRDGTILTLGDVAEIREGFVDQEVITRVDGMPAVIVRVGLVEGQSLAEIADEVHAWLASYEAPRDAEVFVWSSQSEPQIRLFSTLLRIMATGVLLVLLLLILVFDLRIALWITVGIPLSFAGSLIFFGPAGQTMNMGTLLGLFLMIGLVVDDALVVGESIASELERGLSPLDAAISGVRAVAAPITIAAVTTVLAFVPFAFLTAGPLQITRVLPVIAFFVLAVSLIEALFILPAHLSHRGRWSLWPLRAIQERTAAWIQTLSDRTVAQAVVWAVRNYYVTLALGFVLSLVSVALLQSEAVRIKLGYETSSRYVQAELELPVGTPLDVTAEVAEQLAETAHAVNEQLPGEPIRSVSVFVGQPSQYPQTGPLITQSHVAGVHLQLTDESLRQSDAAEVSRAWQQKAGDIKQAGHLEIFSGGQLRPPSDLAYALLHKDEDALHAAAAQMREFMQGVPGVIEIGDSLMPGKRHLEVELTPAGEAGGLTPAAISGQLRARIHGLLVQRIQRGHEEIDVMVRFPEEDRSSLRALENERIQLRGGVEAPLSEVGRLSESRDLTQRLRINGVQAAEVFARADRRVVTTSQAQTVIEEELLPRMLEEFPGLEILPGQGVRDQQITFETLRLMLPIMLIVMYVLLAGFLRSYWKPLVAAAGLPLAFTGSVVLHWLLGWDYDWMSLLGAIAVCGVVVNDSLVLLDRYNTLRRENRELPAVAAAAAATRHRFRAVFLTSLTTILGLSPLLYERSEALISVVPFVVSMIGGLILTSVFVIFVLPALVMAIEGRRD